MCNRLYFYNSLFQLYPPYLSSLRHRQRSRMCLWVRYLRRWHRFWELCCRRSRHFLGLWSPWHRFHCMPLPNSHLIHLVLGFFVFLFGVWIVVVNWFGVAMGFEEVFGFFFFFFLECLGFLFGWRENWGREKGNEFWIWDFMQFGFSKKGKKFKCPQTSNRDVLDFAWLDLDFWFLFRVSSKFLHNQTVVFPLSFNFILK